MKFSTAPVGTAWGPSRAFANFLQFDCAKTKWWAAEYAKERVSQRAVDRTELRRIGALVRADLQKRRRVA